ncbi:hypothetical protein LPJ70_001994, partial [Coemansia sp. RSA 2708]
SLAATQLITKEKLTATAAIPHSPSRVATPHRVVYSPTRRPSAAQTTHGPKRNTINGAAMMLERLVSKHEDRHRTSLPAPRQSLSKERSSCDGAHEPEIEETKVPFLPARRYVQKAHILAACGQTAPIDWVSGGLQACGVLLPNLDPTQHSQEQMNELESDAGLCKIGEATYSEVFSAQWRYVPRTRYDKFNSKKGAVKGERLMQVALKIIPFGNSSVKSGTGETQTTLRDLYQEIGATLALSRLSERERGKLQEARTQVKMPLKPKERELGANFVKAFRVCICQGPLPEPLLRAWDRWQGEYPDLCENSRPDYYPANQLFAVFVLEMGGETLENANVATWKEARSIIRQLALSMALAERNNRFEHRDLHWGNIMVTRYNSNLTFLYQLPPTGSRHKSTLISIPSYRVRCTIIDYTLSRLHIDNDDAEGVSKPASYDPSNNVFYVALKDQALFQGQGDIQFDVYRQMRGCAHDDWEGFHPHTNVLWLTYVLQKILTTKSPAIRDELMAFAETKLGSPPESVSLEVRRAAAQELLRRWMHEFEQCESSSQVLQCALLDLYLVEMSEPAHDNSTDDVGSVPAFFREHSEFLDSLTQVADSAGNVESWTQDSAPTSEQELLRGLCKTLDGYQEQPTCLDPYLERIVGQLMAVVREYVYAYHDSMDRQLPIPISTTRLDGVFELLYTLCKVRGYKIILQFFPHAVADVEPVFATLWRYSADLGTTGWPARYVLLIWLSLLAMVPFDIESIDSEIVEQPMIKGVDSNTAQPLIDRWITQGKLYLTRSGCEMEGAAVMLARLLSRKDAAARQPQFIEWAAREISDAARPAITGGSSGGLQIGSVLRINGALRVLCHLFSAMDSAESLAPQIPRTCTGVPLSA